MQRYYSILLLFPHCLPLDTPLEQAGGSQQDYNIYFKSYMLNQYFSSEKESFAPS